MLSQRLQMAGGVYDPPSMVTANALSTRITSSSTSTYVPAEVLLPHDTVVIMVAQDAVDSLSLTGYGYTAQVRQKISRVSFRLCEAHGVSYSWRQQSTPLTLL